MASNPANLDPPTEHRPSRGSKPGSIDLKENIDDIEVEDGSVPCEWLERYPLIANKTPEELKAIEKSLVRKLDWRFLPMVSLMLVMK